MFRAIMSTLSTMGWLGVVLAFLVAINIICNTVVNVNEGEPFSWKRMGTGLGKSAIFYGSAVLLSVAFTMLPYINTMIINDFGVELLASDTLNTLSSAGVVAIVVGTVAVLGKKAYLGVINLSNMCTDGEVITWEIEVPEDEEEN